MAESNVARFREAYTEKLTAAVQKHPGEYAYGVDRVSGVVEKMLTALAKGDAQVGPAVKAAARKLGVKPTAKAIREFLTAEAAG